MKNLMIVFISEESWNPLRAPRVATSLAIKNITLRQKEETRKASSVKKTRPTSPGVKTLPLASRARSLKLRRSVIHINGLDRERVGRFEGVEQGLLRLFMPPVTSGH